MEPGRPLCLPQRIWAVAIRTQIEEPLAVCDRCGPLQRSPGQALRTAALQHLARHAQRDVTPPHLRTCQCGRNDCPWHGRTRGCSGSILLALIWSPGPATWRLADLCHQCCTSTPNTAPVPHRTPPAAAHCPRPATPPPDTTEEEHLLAWDSACPYGSTHDGACEGTCPP